MTAFEPFDPFARRITEAIDEIAEARPPAYLDDVLRLTARTSQRRRPALWRLSPMNRLAYAAAAAAIIAVVLGGAVILRPNSNVGGPPSPSPARSAAQSAAPVLAPESLRSTWLADAGPIASGGAPSLARLVISAAGNRVSVFESGVETFPSRPMVSPADELDLVSTAPVGGCQIGDVGRYGFAFRSDGTIPDSDRTVLGLTLVADSCAARATRLEGTWVHAIDAESKGGRGAAAVFSPMFLITLPAGSYTADPVANTLTVGSTSLDRTLNAISNPVGWTNPCNGGGTKRPIDPTIEAFTAYLRTLPGFTVNSTDLTIDGHPAVRLTIPSISTVDCASHRVFEWTDNVPGGIGSWKLNQGETDVLYLVEVDGNLVLLQWLGKGMTTAEEEALFATVHFTDTLPQ
jgi:hypothetical protein